MLYYPDARLNFSIDEINDFVDIRLNNLDIVMKLQTVHVVDSSFETAFVFLHSWRIPDNLADFEVCSTLERSIQLLGIHFQEDVLEGRIQNLAFSY